MSSLEEVKLARSLATNKIQAAGKKLQDSIANQRTRNAERYYNTVAEEFQKFEALHIKYALIAKVDLDEASMQQVFFDASEMVDLAETNWSVYKEQVDVRESIARADKDEQARQRKKADQQGKMKIEIFAELQEITDILQAHADKVEQGEQANKTVLSKEIEYLEERLKKAKISCQEYTEVVDDQEAETMLRERNKTERAFRENAFKVRSYTETDVGGSTTASAATSRRTSPNRDPSFRYKKMEFPKFGGIIRNYSTFRRDFKDIVQDNGAYDDKHMSHILRHECLTGEAKNLVHNIHNLADLWKKLDDKYDDPGEVVEQISKQITDLRKVEEGDYSSFIKLVDILERANLDLTAVQTTAILNNPMTVRLILTKCPRTIKENLAKELSSKKQEEEFDVMLKFLIERRKEATRLARLQEDVKPARFQPQNNNKKGAAHVVDSKHDGNRKDKRDKDSQKGWDCIVKGCSYNKRHFLSECRTFKKMDVNDKGKIVLEKKLCVLCLGPGHAVDDCPRKAAGWKECDTGACGRWHSRLLHGATVQGLVLTAKNTVQTGQSERTLLLAQSITTAGGKEINTLWDSGSTISLVTNNFAREMGLQGVDCCFELTGVGNKKQVFSTKIYMVPLISTEGNEIAVHAFGIDAITSELSPVNLDPVADAFNITKDKIGRPAGKVDLLIGMNHVEILPVKTEVNKKLALYSSIFGSGYVVGGTIENDGAKAEQLFGFAQQVSHAGGRTLQPMDFLSAEAFGVDIPKRCKYCRGCKECGFRARSLTWTEQKELTEIEKGLSLDTVNKCWTANYPFKTDPAILKNNHAQAKACMLSLEKRLVKNGQFDKFNEQFQDAVTRGVFKELSVEEADQYVGPVNYVTLTEAYKDGEQTTTPLRLCMNSSMRYQGVSLNDLLMKGPSALNNIFSVLLNFRTFPTAFVKDLSKFYQSIKVGERDKHLRRVLWRGDGINTAPKIYTTETVNFGDKPAGCVALTGLRQTADLYQHIDQEAAQKLKDNNYVDDVATGSDTKEQAIRLSTNMDKIVEMGGFKFKSTIMSGDAGEPRKVLGTGWDTEIDTLFIDVKVNTSPKRKGIRTQPNIDFDKVKTNFPEQITKRIIWRVVLGQFDLLGLACIFFIRLKLLMRDLSGAEEQKIGWDTPLAKDIRDRFVNILDMMGGVQELRFPRCITPEGKAEGKKPDLLIFGDGSKQAFCALAYIRWEMKDGGYKCFLLTGKTRVAPIRKISIPRLELLGSVAAVRLAESIQDSLSIEIGNRYFFTDSSAVYGMIRGECGSFQEFVGTRTGEIKSKSKPETEWFWIPTNENLSDLGTRDDVTPATLHKDSVYLNGSEWMKDDFSTWPVSQKPGGQIPEEEKCPAARTNTATATEPIFRYDKFSSFFKLVRVTKLVFNATEKLKEFFHANKKNNGKTELRHCTAAEAENYLFLSNQTDLQEQFEKGKLVSLSPRTIEVKVKGKAGKIIVTSGRLGNALSVGYDKEYLPLLSYKTGLSHVIMKEAHQMDHAGVDRTLQRSRNTAWIIKGRRLAKVITRSCYTCKLRNKELETQVMAPLPASRLPPTPVFFSTAIDLFGPLEIRDTVKRRTTRKCWGVIFCCTVTSAVHLEVTEDYSCDSFLLCLRRFFNLRGIPARIQSDPGSQLMGAAKQLGTWDFSRIKEWSKGMKTEWYTTPTDSQHYNGSAEIMIKATKKQLSTSLKERTFTKGEMDTLMSNVGYLINSRPLMKRAGECPMSGGPITPLHLLGGRSTIDIPAVNMDGDAKLTKRLKFIEQTTQEFWKKWFTQVFQSLVPSYKWHTEKRNVKVGDIVLLKESSQLKGEYKLVKVTKADPGQDGKVRRVTVAYKNLSPTGSSLKQATQDLKKTAFSETERCVQNIVVIVPVDWSQEEQDIAVSSGLTK